ncbi:MAG: hypothetical protein ACOYH4_00065 [Saccharofermentanales bacterium]
MNIIKTKTIRRRMKYGALRKNTVNESTSDAYLCPRCEKLVSYVPVHSVKRCVYCNQELNWDLPFIEREPDEDVLELEAELEKNKKKK